MYVGAAVDRHPEAVSASSHRRQRPQSVWRPCAAKAICDAHFDRRSSTPPSVRAFAATQLSCWTTNQLGSIATLRAFFRCVCSCDGRWVCDDGML